jgi:hypothetical protein
MGNQWVAEDQRKRGARDSNDYSLYAGEAPSREHNFLQV